MSKRKDSLSSDFWKSLNNNHRLDELNNLKSYIVILIFLKHISDNKNSIKGLNITIPEECDFETIQKIADYEVSYIGHDINIGQEINSRVNLIANTNPLLEGVINFVDFTNDNALGKDYNQNIVLGKIIRLIEEYEYDLNASNTLSNTTWIELFDFLMQSFVENIGKHTVGIDTPNELGVLIAKLLYSKKNTNESLYDPVFGTGNLLFSTIQEMDNEVTVYGEEINSENVFLAKLKFLFHGFSNYEFQTNDVLKFPSFTKQERNLKELFKPLLRKFDYIVSCPPFNVKSWYLDPTGDLFDRWNSNTGIPPKNCADFAYVLHIVNSLKTNGTGACVVSNGALFRGGSERDIRKYLIDNGFIKGIVGLPAKLFYGTGIPCSIIILGNQPNDNKKDVFIIDASSEFMSERFLNKLLPENIDHIADVWENKKEENEFSRRVSYNEIVENDYNLSVPRYFQKEIEGVKLVDILEIINGKRDNLPKTGKFIRIRDLKDNVVDFTLDINSVENKEMSSIGIRKIEVSCLLLAVRWKTLKPTYFKYEGEPIYISNDIIATRINENIVNINYLINELNADYVKEQINRFRNTGTIPFIRRDDLFNIKIHLLSLEEQNKNYFSIINEYIRSIVKESTVTSDEKKIDVEDENSFLRHQIAGSLKNARGALKFIKKILDEQVKPEFNNLYGLKADEKLETTLFSYLEILDRDLNSINKSVNRAGDKIELMDLNIENFDLIEFIKEYAESLKIRSKNFYSINLNLDENAITDYGISAIHIEGDKDILRKMFDNIIENAEKHAFSYGINNGNQNKISFELIYDFEDFTVQLDICNTGNPLPENMTHESMIRKGSSSGSHSGDGIGMWFVNEVMKIHKGHFGYTDEENGSDGIGGEYVTSIELTFPIIPAI